ncbi:MAG TPA: enoyl-CoA hydratase-related protein [Desulfomonilaceae bacterium]|nr:enoyl-CoA hydratase-related protein [Desulfomonilaceae bacterium]
MSDLLYETRDKVAWITINRESRRNAVSLEMIDLFFAYLARAAGDEEVRVVCLTAAGNKAFCSGADLSSGGGASPLAGARKYADLLKRMSEFPKPLVARVNGNCIAGGMGFMLSCDLAYAGETAKFGTPEVNVGLFPMMVAALVFRNALRKKALEMVYTARMMSAGDAEDMGLITRSVPDGDLDLVVNQALASIAAKAPLAVQFGRKALAVAQDMGLNEALDYMCGQLGAVLATEDAMEGIAAFVQKREPVWKGR